MRDKVAGIQRRVSKSKRVEVEQADFTGVDQDLTFMEIPMAGHGREFRQALKIIPHQAKGFGEAVRAVGKDFVYAVAPGAKKDEFIGDIVTFDRKALDLLQPAKGLGNQRRFVIFEVRATARKSRKGRGTVAGIETQWPGQSHGPAQPLEQSHVPVVSPSARMVGDRPQLYEDPLWVRAAKVKLQNRSLTQAVCAQRDSKRVRIRPITKDEIPCGIMVVQHPETGKPGIEARAAQNQAGDGITLQTGFTLRGNLPMSGFLKALCFGFGKGNGLRTKPLSKQRLLQTIVP